MRGREGEGERERGREGERERGERERGERERGREAGEMLTIRISPPCTYFLPKPWTLTLIHKTLNPQNP